MSGGDTKRTNDNTNNLQGVYDRILYGFYAQDTVQMLDKERKALAAERLVVERERQTLLKDREWYQAQQQQTLNRPSPPSSNSEFEREWKQFQQVWSNQQAQWSSMLRTAPQTLQTNLQDMWQTMDQEHQRLWKSYHFDMERVVKVQTTKVLMQLKAQQTTVELGLRTVADQIAELAPHAGPDLGPQLQAIQSSISKLNPQLLTWANAASRLDLRLADLVPSIKADMKTIVGDEHTSLADYWDLRLKQHDTEYESIQTKLVDLIRILQATTLDTQKVAGRLDTIQTRLAELTKSPPLNIDQFKQQLAGLFPPVNSTAVARVDPALVAEVSKMHTLLAELKEQFTHSTRVQSSSPPILNLAAELNKWWIQVNESLKQELRHERQAWEKSIELRERQYKERHDTWIAEAKLFNEGAAEHMAKAQDSASRALVRSNNLTAQWEDERKLLAASLKTNEDLMAQLVAERKSWTESLQFIRTQVSKPPQTDCSEARRACQEQKQLLDTLLKQLVAAQAEDAATVHSGGRGRFSIRTHHTRHSRRRK